MDFNGHKTSEYVEEHTTAEPEILQRLSRETHQKIRHPHMLSGAYQGRLLSLISKITKPKSILEIGTFTGYSAICLAEGLLPDGKLITIDHNDELRWMAEKYFEEAGLSGQIQLINGEAASVLDSLDEKFDLVFLDADKANYILYYEKVVKKMNSGGVILADNVLWYGKVLEETTDHDEDTRILKEFNMLLTRDPRVEVIMLPIRDGISLIRKI